MTSAVTRIPAATPADALAHFQRRLSVETDCWDVHQALTEGPADFVLLDVRSPDLFAHSHIPGAVNLPHGKMTRRVMARWPADTVFVVYCAGPHCNGANKAAVRLATLGLAVKEMIGGMTGWADEGFEFASDGTADDPGSGG